MNVPKGARNVRHKHIATGANMPAHNLPPNFRRELNFGHWRMQNARRTHTHTRQSNRDSPTNSDPTPAPTHSLAHTLLHYDLSSLSHPLTSHPSCPPHSKKNPPPPPQLQEIPNDLHHQCVRCISAKSKHFHACTHAHTTNTHTKHINEQRPTHEPYVQTNKKADRRSDTDTHLT